MRQIDLTSDPAPTQRVVGWMIQNGYELAIVVNANREAPGQ